MSHKSIRLLIEDTVKDIRDDIKYSYGKETDFNQAEKRAFLYVNVAPLSSTPAYRSNNGTTNYMKQWNVEMAFYKHDQEASLDYALILDETDDLVDRFINKLNYFTDRSDEIIIQSITQTPFIKALADVLTGHAVNFQILANDTFDYCPDCP